MAKRSHGFRHKTRQKLSSASRSKFTVEKFLADHPIGSRVVVHQEPSSHKGMPHPRFRGIVGIVTGKRGQAYLVELKTGGKLKTVIARPEHLKPLKPDA
ncbi:MAG: 50S ribosomal protein L21e [Nanoarchaeota archaeon]|nr:50S ribosomal protein L21e [Nanoarchaeota archaeon]